MAQRATSRTAKAKEATLPDQTPAEAEDAAAQMAEHEYEANGNKYPDQTVGDAQLANAIAEDSTGSVQINVLESGLILEGAVLLKGSIVNIAESSFQDEGAQEATYGKVYYKKA